MTPDPTPVSGMMPVEVSTSALVWMRTTAGLTAAATLIVAELSSTVTGWFVAPTVVAFGAGTPLGRSSSPVARSASTVPPEARTADSNDAVTSMPTPPRPERAPPPAVLTGAVGTALGAGAGSYQRSGVGGAGSGSPSWRDQSVRASDGGEYRSTAGAVGSSLGGVGDQAGGWVGTSCRRVR